MISCPEAKPEPMAKAIKAPAKAIILLRLRDDFLEREVWLAVNAGRLFPYVLFFCRVELDIDDVVDVLWFELADEPLLVKAFTESTPPPVILWGEGVGYDEILLRLIYLFKTLKRFCLFFIT